MQGTYVRYDDWPHRKALLGPATGTFDYGQKLAHDELTAKYRVAWSRINVSRVNVVFRVEAIGSERIGVLHTLGSTKAEDEMLAAKAKQKEEAIQAKLAARRAGVDGKGENAAGSTAGPTARAQQQKGAPARDVQREYAVAQQRTAARAASAPTGHEHTNSLLWPASMAGGPRGEPAHELEKSIGEPRIIGAAKPRVEHLVVESIGEHAKHAHSARGHSRPRSPAARKDLLLQLAEVKNTLIREERFREAATLGAVELALLDM